MNADDQAAALAERWAAHAAFEAGRTGPTCEPDMLDRAEIDSLFAWLRHRVAEYRDGARSVGYEAEPSRDDLAEWIGPDLGEPFESDRGLMLDLLDVALASDREPLPVFDTRAVSVARLDWPGLLGAEVSP